MSVDWKAVALETSRHCLDAAEVCALHARQLADSGQLEVSAAYQHAAVMFRRIHAGEHPIDMHATLEASIAIFAGLSR